MERMIVYKAPRGEAKEVNVARRMPNGSKIMTEPQKARYNHGKEKPPQAVRNDFTIDMFVALKVNEIFIKYICSCTKIKWGGGG